MRAITILVLTPQKPLEGRDNGRGFGAPFDFCQGKILEQPTPISVLRLPLHGLRQLVYQEELPGTGRINRLFRYGASFPLVRRTEGTSPFPLGPAEAHRAKVFYEVIALLSRQILGAGDPISLPQHLPIFRLRKTEKALSRVDGPYYPRTGRVSVKRGLSRDIAHILFHLRPTPEQRLGLVYLFRDRGAEFQRLELSYKYVRNEARVPVARAMLS